jgi:pimeloyl-ACP methyl ester carboxylesterase
MSTNPLSIIFLHGSFHGSWCWDPLVPHLPPSWSVLLPNLTMRRADGTPAGLSDHVDQVRQLVTKTASPLAILAHSYAGMLIAEALDRAAIMPNHLLFLDAFLPLPGQSAFDLLGPAAESLAQSALAGWMQPPPAGLFGIDEPQVATWAQEKLKPMPLATHQQMTYADTQAICAGRGTYIRCTRFPGFVREQAKAAGWGWPVYDLDCGHDAMIAAPEQLAQLLVQLLDPAASGTGHGASA